MVNRSGSSVSHGFGDNLLPVQEIYGAGGNVAVHLVSAYAQETLYDGRLDIELGRMNVENDFASSPLYCGFMNNALCGDPKALPAGDIGHSAYPDAVWALRLKVRPTPVAYVQSGVYEVNEGLYSPNFRSGWKFGSSQDSGVYIPVEAAWELKFGADAPPGHYTLGFRYDSSSTFKDFTNALATAGVPGYTSQTHTGNFLGWALADQMLVRNRPGNDTGLIACHRNNPNCLCASVHRSAVGSRFLGRKAPKTAPESSSPMSVSAIGSPTWKAPNNRWDCLCQTTQRSSVARNDP